MTTTDYQYTLPARLIHLGLAVFGVFSYITAEGAEHSDGGFGYLLHAYLGLTLTLFILLRLADGLAGTTEMRFLSWLPFSRAQWILALEDIKKLLSFKLPERGMHQGLAGLVEAFGLILFAWMGGTGTAMYLVDEGSNGMLFEVIEEMHETGEGLIPLFLAVHVGAVIVHSIAGKSNWQKMWNFKNR